MKDLMFLYVFGFYNERIDSNLRIEKKIILIYKIKFFGV